MSDKNYNNKFGFQQSQNLSQCSIAGINDE